jgi:enhancer of yellow 2 transcription factor
MLASTDPLNKPIQKQQTRLISEHLGPLYNVDVAKRKLFIDQKLKEFERDTEVGKRFEERLKEVGWHTEMKNYCKGLIREKGLNNVRAEQMAEIEEKMMIKGKNVVPLGVRDEILMDIVTMLREEGLLNKEKKYKQDLDKY